MSLRPYIPILFCFVVLIIPKPGKFIDEDELKRLVDELATKVKTSLRLKKTVTYSAEGKRYINVDCCFTKHVPLTEAHEIASHVEKEIAEYFAGAVVTVHIEPECE